MRPPFALYLITIEATPAARGLEAAQDWLEELTGNRPADPAEALQEFIRCVLVSNTEYDAIPIRFRVTACQRIGNGEGRP